MIDDHSILLPKIRGQRGDSMKIRKISIENYRALDHLDIDLNPAINVIYGKNGVGKSSIIYILNDMIGLFSEKTSREQAVNIDSVKIFPPERVRDKEKRASATIEFINGEKISVSAEVGEAEEKKEGALDPATRCIRFIPGMTAHKLVQKIENNAVTLGLSIPPKFVYTRGIIDLDSLKEKFFKREFEESKRRVEEFQKAGTMEYTDPALQKIRDVIKKINPEFERIGISEGQEGKFLVVHKKGIPLYVESQLSSGESSAVAMIAEICLNVYAEGKVADSIVLIDEIDASLHPHWQAKIGKILREDFPEVQFIVTSHSPFIWSGLNRDEIVWLDYDDDGNIVKKDVDFAKGGSIEAIIAHYFDSDAYAEDISREFHAIDELIRNKDAEQAERAIDDLKERYGALPIISQFLLKMRMLGL